jgi:hypothetical protein
MAEPPGVCAIMGDDCVDAGVGLLLRLGIGLGLFFVVDDDFFRCFRGVGLGPVNMRLILSPNVP